MKLVLLTSALLTLCLSAQEPARDRTPTNLRLREAWSFLLPEEKEEVAEWYRAEVGYLDTFQNRMINYVVKAEERDRGTWPQAEPLPFFEPSVHAPKQPIARVRLAENSPAAKRAHDRLKRPFLDPLQKTWTYDWSTGEIVAHGEERDAEKIFENALQGLPPLVDLAEALLLRRLDDGSQRATLAAFGHAYTDRSGNVYPGISLYDAWASQKEFEMPDVDTLGIYHTLFDDWRTYVAPVPSSKHKQFYDKLGKRLLDAKHYRQLLEAIVSNYVRGSAVPSTPYSANTLGFNALWDTYAGVPEDLAEELPDAEGWESYLKELADRTYETKFHNAGKNRIAWVDGERARVRATLHRVMKEFGAMDREKLPEPKPKPEPVDTPKED